METDKHEDIQVQALTAVLRNIGNLVAIYLSSGDFERIRALRNYIESMFYEAESAIAKAKTRATAGYN